MTVLKILAVVLAAGFFSNATQAQIGNNSAVLNPNVADESQLAGAAHLDTTLVDAIIDQRPFADMLELNALLSPSLSEAQRGELYAELFIPIDLNTASDPEIHLIPDMSDRMTHEFEEYRPYTSLVQFRQEMGKYVDEAEVARLEQFVFVPLDLNSASEEEFAGVPGAGDRMVREFLEYRPYESMEQFRREMGKYVDEDEVARLERYMTIR